MKLVLLLIFSIFTHLISVGQCTHPDYDALIELYDSTTGPQWNDPSQSWALGKAGVNCEPCTWVGIKCNDEGRVDTLDLINVKLKGSLIDLKLPFLKVLKFSGSDFTTEIPDFQNMPDLIYLELWKCQINGTIPNVSNFGKLTHMDIRENNLEGTCPRMLSRLYL